MRGDAGGGLLLESGRLDSGWKWGCRVEAELR